MDDEDDVSGIMRDDRPAIPIGHNDRDLEYELPPGDEGRLIEVRWYARGLGQHPCFGCGEHLLYEETVFEEFWEGMGFRRSCRFRFRPYCSRCFVRKAAEQAAADGELQ